MKRILFACAGLISILLIGCNARSGNRDGVEAANAVLQQDDGTVLLSLDNAACYVDADNPSSNTAEWTVVISKAGRYKVWLSSATTDTVKLAYSSKVKVNFQDNQLEVDPVIDKVVQNSDEVAFPFYRADSYMGSFYFQEPGEYNIQVISDKVTPKGSDGTMASSMPDIRLMSVFLTPQSR